MNEPDAPGIAADINYLAPGSFINRRFVAPAREVNTGEYLAYPVTIRDARPRQAEFTRASHGYVSRPDAKPRASIEFRTVAYFP